MSKGGSIGTIRCRQQAVGDPQMTDLTESQRVERARRAQMALDEFVAPALALIEANYAEKMITVAASTDPRAAESIVRLANGIKVARQVGGLIEAYVMDGDMAKRDMIHARNIEEMSPAQQRLLKIGAH